MALVELTKDVFHEDDLVLFIDTNGQISMDFVQAVDPKIGNTTVYGVQCKSHDISFNGGIQVWTIHSREELDYPVPSKEKVLRVYTRNNGKYVEVYPREEKE